ncbi:MBL fold metallo-hydrolase [Nocardiopsis halophila]|uniref:MBL fold metallo-hydrolase n=1 Tax=Nocardiopsis halophila TaxID=141692 RepID=UPI0003461D1C|nr:MBL fold metallo-hydrolase [Nocardiopsis halophila]
MFWKRKGKKKGTGEAEEAAAVATDESQEEQEEKEPAEDTAADAESGEETAGGKAGDDAGKKADTDSDDDADTDDESDEDTATASETASDDAKDEESSESEKKDGEKSAKTEKATKAAKGAGAGKAADEDGDGEDAETSAAADESDSDEDGGSDKDGAEDEDKSVAKKKREIEPEEPGIDEPDGDGVQRVRTAGVLQVDGEDYKVVSNTWVVKADDEGVIVIDPAHDAEAIMEAVGDREVYLVACTNGYNTHIGAAIEVAERDEAPIALHRRELRPWRKVHGAEHQPEIEIEAGGSFSAGDLEIDVLGLPGTSSGTVGYYISQLGVVFSGDTLRAGELGTVGDGYIDYTRQLHSVGEVLLSLPPDTRVLPDQGPETSVEEESGNFDSWV